MLAIELGHLYSDIDINEFDTPDRITSLVVRAHINIWNCGF